MTGRPGGTAILAALASLALLAGAAPARGAASPWVVNGPSRLRLVSPYAASPARGEIRLGLEFRTEPGWHVYWKNSGDAGYAPAVRWSGDGLAPGSAPALLWPAPRRFDLPGGLVAFGYEGEVIYPVSAQLESAGRPAVHLAADVDYLVCQVDCIPFRSRLALDQPVAAGPTSTPDPSTAAAIDAWWARLPAPAGAAGSATPELRYDADGPALELAIPGATAGPDADLFLESQELFAVGRPRVRSTAAGVTIRLPLSRLEVDRPLPPAAPFAWTATGLRGAPGAAALEGRSVVSLSPRPAGRAVRLGAARPAYTAAGAALALLAALGLWGLFAGPGDASPGLSAPIQSQTIREALGFAAAAAALWLLYRLSLEVRSEGLAEVELALLGAALLAWLRRPVRRRALRRALAAALLACALAAPFAAQGGGLGAP